MAAKNRIFNLELGYTKDLCLNYSYRVPLILMNILEVKLKSEATESMVCLFSDIELCVENQSDTTWEQSKASKEGAG